MNIELRAKFSIVSLANNEAIMPLLESSLDFSLLAKLIIARELLTTFSCFSFAVCNANNNS